MEQRTDAVSRDDPTRALLAWGVHALTASGSVIGLAALIASTRGDFRAAALWMLLALFVDSVDGTLARALNVGRHAPRVDGRRLDDIVDYLNYVMVPVFFLLMLGSLTHWSIAAAPLLASAYGFSQREAKTQDAFFLGWPSYWNVLALYVWLLDLSPATSSVLVIFFSIGVFVPLKYIYPSQMPILRNASMAGALLWITATSAAVAWPEPAQALHLAEASLAYPLYYMCASAWLGDWLGSRGRA